jgi:hypothetical protein
MADTEVIWKPQPGPQEHLMTCPCDEILLGGSRGSGKTAAILGHFIGKAQRYGKAARGIIFRRQFKQMAEIQRQAQNMFAPLGATYLVTSSTWTFPNGATIRLAHLDDEKDCLAWHGYSFTHVYFDELTNWPNSNCVDKLRATLRSADGVPCQIVCTSNPGGPGHHWVKQRYVSPWPRGMKVITDQHGLKRVFIPCFIEHNPALFDKDPGYIQRLKQTGTPQQIKAWLEGSWDITSSGVFDDLWDPAKHCVPDFPLPAQWKLTLGYDWGFARPSSLCIFAYVTDPNPPGQTLPAYFPRGSHILINEWYTCKTNPEDGGALYNTGQRLLPEDVGVGIAQRIRPYGNGRVRSASADANIFSKQQGPQSVYDQMRAGMLREGWNVPFTPAVSDRPAGLQMVRQLLSEARKDRAEAPGLWISETCTAWLATVPILEHDKDGDDVNSEGADHAWDATRYALWSKPRTARTIKIRFG